MTPRPAASSLIPLLVAACAETATSDQRTTEPEPDSGLSDGSYPPEDRHISLKLWPIYDVDAVLAATETSLPGSLDGVEVCVKSARPHQGSSDDFVDTGGPCTISVAGEPIVVNGVPPQSELVVTAAKEGYWPSVFTVVTGQWSLDVTMNTQHHTRLRLLAKGSPWPGIDPPPSERVGLLTVAVDGSAGFIRASLGGVAISLEPGPSSGPFYGDGWTFDVTADRTLPATWGSAFPMPSELVWENAKPRPVAFFADIEAGDHILRLGHPRASCDPEGWLAGDTIWGFPAALNEIRVPVLAGHFTSAVVAGCTCHNWNLLSLDPATCEPAASSDGGLP